MSYRVPENPGFLGGFAWKPFLLGWAIAMISQVVATEWIAYRFAQLGFAFSESVLYGHWAGLPIYLPLCWGKWCFLYRQWLFHHHPLFTMPLLSGAMIGVVGIIIGLTNKNASFNRRAKKLAANMEDLYGSSRWAQRKDLEKAGLLQQQKGLLLCAWRETEGGPLQYLYDDSDRHVINAAATGTGKSASLGIANALLWYGSMLVVDIKRELYQASAGFRQSQGHVCLKFEPLNPEESVKINPLAWIRFETRFEVSDVQKFTEGIASPANEGAESSHWNDTSTSLLDGVVLHEAYKSKIKRGRMVTMTDISASLSPLFKPPTKKRAKSSAEAAGSPEKKKKPKVDPSGFTQYLAEMATFVHDPEGRMNWRDPEGRPTRTHPVVREKAMEALQRDVKEASSVLSTAKKRFRLYSDPLVQQATNGCDVEIEQLVDHVQPVSLYLVIPPSEKRRLAPLIRIILLMVLGRLTEKQVVRRHKLLILADEFPTLGYMAPMEDALSYVRSYGIRFLLFVQNFSQISSPKRYGSDNEIVPNCQIKILFTISDLKTAKYASEEIGPQTIQHAAISFSHKHPTAQQLQAASAHVQNTKRDLIDPSELMRLELPQKNGDRIVAPGECIVLVFGTMPIKGTQAFWFFDPTFRDWVNRKPSDQSKALVQQDLAAEVLAS